eukprot:12969201-Ditylum_brightwellii.AAC.1
MDRLRKNAHSTKLRAAFEHVDDPPPKQENKTNAVFVALGVTETDGTVYTDLTGKFPITSNNGSQYMLITYDYDSNTILARPLKSRNNSDMLD